MLFFGDSKNLVIEDQYIQALEDDDIDIHDGVVEKAKYGNPEAMHKIGCAYASKDNKKKATLWLGISAALGFYESQISLGDLLKEDNPECALQWYEKAQKNGLVHAGCRIGDKLFKNRRYYEAEEEYIKAAEGGDPYSQNHLGEFYRDGYCLKKRYYVYTAGVDYGMALKWFQKASDQNYAEAHYNIGYMYEMGWGAKEDKYKALYWYEKSNVGGYGGAHATIERLNNEGYIYFPQLENLSSFTTTTETETPESTADVKSLVDLSELKKELQALEKCDTEENLVIVNTNDLNG